MSAVAPLLAPAAYTLASYFEDAGIHDYAEWAHAVELSKRPRPYQVGDLNFFAAMLPRTATWSHPGCGKTLPAQAWALWLVGLGNKVVCIMPPTLVKQFRESFLETYQGVTVRIEICYGNRTQRDAQIQGWEQGGWPDVLITGYEQFKGEREVRDVVPVVDEHGNPVFKLNGQPRTRTRRTQRAAYKKGDPASVETFGWGLLLDRGYNVLVVDEAINVKEPSTFLYDAVWSFVCPQQGEQSNGLLLMDGEPAKTNADDVFGLLRLLNPDWYHSRREFDNLHCTLNLLSRRRQVLEYRNLDILHARLYARARRITKREAFAGGGMPPRVMTEIRVDLGEQHREVYRQITEERLVELGDDTIIPIANASALRQSAHQCLLNPDKFSAKPIKENALIEQIEQLVTGLGGRKVILYLWFRDSVERMLKQFAKRNPAVLYGGVTGNAREQQRKKFIEDESCRMLVANMQSGGVGVDGLQSVCSHAIIAEGLTSPGAFEQVVGRLERGGQTEAINIYLLTVRGTISVALRNSLLKKEAQNNEVVRDKKALLKELIGADGLIGTFD